VEPMDVDYPTETGASLSGLAVEEPLSLDQYGSNMEQVGRWPVSLAMLERQREACRPVLERVVPEVEQPCSPPNDSGTLLTLESRDVLGLGATPPRVREGDTPSKATSARRDEPVASPSKLVVPSPALAPAPSFQELGMPRDPM
jgi:hypothetical protein